MGQHETVCWNTNFQYHWNSPLEPFVETFPRAVLVIFLSREKVVDGACSPGIKAISESVTLLQDTDQAQLHTTSTCPGWICATALMWCGPSRGTGLMWNSVFFVKQYEIHRHIFSEAFILYFLECIQISEQMLTHKPSEYHCVDSVHQRC